MRTVSIGSLTALLAFAVATSADEYALDKGHAGVTFKISHAGISQTFGRFNTIDGAFRLDPDPAKAAFVLNIVTDSIDTANKQRDDHLRSPDFFNVKQFPYITFQSTAVKKIDNGYEVTGDLSLHGVKKSKTLTLVGGNIVEFPKKGDFRTGFTTDLKLNRSEFGMEKAIPMIGDEVVISISFEGTKK